MEVPRALPVGLHGMDVFVSRALTEDQEIAFNAGSHYELIRLTYEDFEKLVNPKIADFSVKMKYERGS